MISKYKIIYIITFLLLLLSVSMSFFNYTFTLKSTQENLEKASLPLSTDNIYSEIQTHLMKPNLVASMMAEDTFLKDWLLNNEHDKSKIIKYLKSIKNKYELSTVFLLSQNTKNYYNHDSCFKDKVKKENPAASWYYNFINKPNIHEINIALDELSNNPTTMFINYKIYNDKSKMIGITGIGLDISYIDNMLKRFRQKYKLEVFFIDKDTNVVLYERAINKVKNLKEDSTIYKYKNQFLAKKKNTLKYTTSDDTNYLLHSKYIEKLDLYLLVRAKVSDFTSSVVNTLYLNLFVSLFITLIILYIIVKMVHKHNIKLENLANNDGLTNLPNRRVFDEKLTHLILLNQRKNMDLTVLFFDIDNFKKVNDNFGHDIGDKVLVRMGEILKENVRESDLYARWGGEEFIIVYVDSPLENTKIVAEKLRNKIEKDKQLYSFINTNVTASFGLTKIEKEDTVESVLKRADSFLYKAKESGKNKIVLN